MVNLKRLNMSSAGVKTRYMAIIRCHSQRAQSGVTPGRTKINVYVSKFACSDEVRTFKFQKYGIQILVQQY